MDESLSAVDIDDLFLNIWLCRQFCLVVNQLLFFCSFCCVIAKFVEMFQMEVHSKLKVLIK